MRPFIGARKVLNKYTNYIILDTETTGIGDNDVIVQLAIIDINGNPLINTLIKPSKRKRMSATASAIHGISMKMLDDAPTLKDIFPKLKEIFSNNTVAIYNAQFDLRMLQQTVNQDLITDVARIEAECAMLEYSKFIGEYAHFKNEYKWQKLPGGDHSALGDCRATLGVIKTIADAEIIEIPKKWFEFWK